MFNKEKLKGFVAGVCVTALLAGAATVFAQTIDVAMNGIRVYWDGVEKILRDPNGDKVEPMIYNGTTYVPLRAMSELLGKEVSWDQQNLSVYVGEKPTAATMPIDQFPKDLIDYYCYSVRTGENAKFNLKDKTVQCNNLILGGSPTQPGKGKSNSNLYILNGKYSKLVGKAVYSYTSVGSSSEGRIIFYSVANDGTEQEIATYNLRQTQDPIDIDVNLQGVQNLRMYMYGFDGGVAFYDASFLSN